MPPNINIHQPIEDIMRKSLLNSCLGFSVAAIAGFGPVAAPAAAQTMKPGLWEITNKMGGDQGAKMAAAQAQMQQQFASMPPAQRKQMEEMMAKQGVNMSPGAPGGGMATRICVTKDMAARNQPPSQNRGDCKQETMQKSGNTTKFKFTCTNPPSSGEGTVTLHNPESYSMHMKVQGGGQQGQMTMDAQGKWLSNDCGSVKPAK
jgi:hypothetical protein